jgi:hypothetical protein
LLTNQVWSIKAGPTRSASLSKPFPERAKGAQIRRPAKREENETKSEVERAKLEAQTAKASEASVQRKLADAEVALKKAKEEAELASAQVERAKAEAQNARESETAIRQILEAIRPVSTKPR